MQLFYYPLSTYRPINLQVNSPDGTPAFTVSTMSRVVHPDSHQNQGIAQTSADYQLLMLKYRR